MTKLQIISKLWSIIFDLILIIKGESDKSLEDIEKDIDIAEHNCRRYADTEDDELPRFKIAPAQTGERVI